MKKVLKIILIVSIMIFINASSFASINLYDAEEYIIKIQNINEQIEEINLVNYEECPISETGVDYTDSIEKVSLYGDDEIPLVTGYNTENYFIKQTVIYNYLYGEAARNIEKVSSSGSEKRSIGKELKSMRFATDKKFKNEKEFQKECKEAKDYTFICVRSITYTAYRITSIKELEISSIKNGNFTYKHDDLSNLKIGLRIKDVNQEYKLFISEENNMSMTRAGGESNRDKEKIVIFDYIIGNYKTNANKPLENTRTDKCEGITFILICFVIAVLIVKFEKKRKK